MSEFKTTFLAIALMVNTVDYLSSVQLNPIEQCIKITNKYYGNDQKDSGMENFQYSFFKKTEAIINDQFEQIEIVSNADYVEYYYENYKREIRLALVMGYFKYLYEHKEMEPFYDQAPLEPYKVLSRTDWCSDQAPLVITHIQMDKIGINADDFNKDKQEQICLRYVKYLDIYNDLGEETFENEFKKFYFETTEDMITAEKMYPKTNGVESDTHDNIMFYLKTYTVGYYGQYIKLVNNLALQKNAVFMSVNNFCNFNGIDIVQNFYNSAKLDCMKVIEQHYGNGGKTSGLENFQYSFLNKTEEIINKQFEAPTYENDEEREDKRTLVLNYYRFLAKGIKIAQKDVKTYNKWCSIQAPLVLEHIKNNSSINFLNADDLNDEEQKQICEDFVDYLVTFISIQLGDFNYELQFFYFKTTESMVTVENFYKNKIVDRFEIKKSEKQFYLKEYTVAYYNQYKDLVKNHLDDYVFERKSVDHFCNQ